MRDRMRISKWGLVDDIYKHFLGRKKKKNAFLDGCNSASFSLIWLNEEALESIGSNQYAQSTLRIPVYLSKLNDWKNGVTD